MSNSKNIEKNGAPVGDPFEMFATWMEDAVLTEEILPNAVSLASVSQNGQPSIRMVLLKNAGSDGFVFYTNLESRKARDLEGNPLAAMCVHWKKLARQVRIEGKVCQVTDAEADSYFSSRDRGSKIGAWASRQSRPMDGRFELEKAIEEFSRQYGNEEVPRPPFWSGYRLEPHVIEFWEEKPSRLHDRLHFEKVTDVWVKTILFP